MEDVVTITVSWGYPAEKPPFKFAFITDTNPWAIQVQGNNKEAVILGLKELAQTHENASVRRAAEDKARDVEQGRY